MVSRHENRNSHIWSSDRSCWCPVCERKQLRRSALWDNVGSVLQWQLDTYTDRMCEWLVSCWDATRITVRTTSKNIIVRCWRQSLYNRDCLIFMPHLEGGDCHAKMLAQIPMGQAAPCALACRQGNHGLLGEAGLQISIPQRAGTLLRLYEWCDARYVVMLYGGL